MEIAYEFSDPYQGKTTVDPSVFKLMQVLVNGVSALVNENDARLHYSGCWSLAWLGAIQCLPQGFEEE